MAQIDNPPFAYKEVETLSDTIDRLLYLAHEAWSELPKIEQEISSWDPVDAETYLIEWNLEEMHLASLETFYAQSMMTQEQQRRYQELLAVVEKHRPIIERLLGPTITVAELMQRES